MNMPLLSNESEFDYNTKFDTMRVIKGVIMLSLTMLLGLFFIIPKVTNKHTIESANKHAINIAEQMSINKKIFKSTLNDEEKLNIALTKLTKNYYDKSDVKVSFLDKSTLEDKDILNYFDNQSSKIYKQIILTGNQSSLLIIKKENSHNFIRVIMPIDEELKSGEQLTKYILMFIFINIIGLIIYYLYIFHKYEEKTSCEHHDLKQKIIDEIAKNVKKEKQLAQSSKSASMGEMMAAIIHQWKQPINAISVSVSSIELDAELGVLDEEQLLKNTASITGQLNHMLDTMDSFRNFFKPEKRTIFDVFETLAKVKKLVGHILREHVTININADEKAKNDIKALGYPNELVQVVINILNNARDVIIERKPKYDDVDINIYEENGNAIIKINDYAGGIPRNIIKDIFEPYVTTKSDSKGTGIGLDMSKTIIEKAGGNIEATNETYKKEDEEIVGACFKITLPQEH
jgi:signal transduction histidine kinase